MKNPITLAYYSHGILSYNSDKEKQEYNFLKTKVEGHIICPNHHIGKLENPRNYQNIIKKVDCVFVSENEGFIGKGSYRECAAALEKNIPIFVIRNKNNKLELERLTELVQVSEYNLFNFGQLISKKIGKKNNYFND